MSQIDNVIDIRRPVRFTIDGRGYQTRLRRQRAADLLLLAGLDPVRYDLGELAGTGLRARVYERGDVVAIRRGSAFVSRDRAGV